MSLLPIVLIPFTSILPVYWVGHTDNYNCPQHIPAYAAAGWGAQEWEQVDQIVWAESRCIPSVSRTHDYGLMQINRHIWQTDVNAAGETMDDLLDPVTGLRWGKYVSESAKSYGWCKWQPWYMSGDWC